METPGTTMSDAEFERLLEEHQPRLGRLARQYADEADCQDLLQEMRLQLWLSLDSFDGRAQLGTWVYRVALNTAISHLRKRRLPLRDPAGYPERGDTGAVHDEMHVLKDFLDSLQPVNRAVLVMDLEGMERSEVADVLGLTPSAVAVRMTRLRQRFEQRYLEMETNNVLG